MMLQNSGNPLVSGMNNYSNQVNQSSGNSGFMGVDFGKVNKLDMLNFGRQFLMNPEKFKQDAKNKVMEMVNSGQVTEEQINEMGTKYVPQAMQFLNSEKGKSFLSQLK